MCLLGNFSTQQNDTQSKGLEKRKVALLPPNKKITYPASSTARSSDCRPDSYVDMTIGPGIICIVIAYYNYMY